MGRRIVGDINPLLRSLTLTFTRGSGSVRAGDSTGALSAGTGRFSRLPNEVALRIFMLYIAITNKDPRASKVYKRIPALTLSAVCRKWRSMMHDNPVLWTTIDSRSLESIEMALSLSEGHPLTLRFVEPSLNIRREMLAWFLYAAPHKKSIEHLEYFSRRDTGSDKLGVTALLTWFVENARRLKTLTFFALASPEESAEVALPDDRTQAPPVQTLNCYGLAGVSFLSSYLSRTLTHIRIWGHREANPTDALRQGETTELVETLSHLPFLTHLELRYIDFQDAQARNVNPIQLPHLQSLQICDHSLSITCLLSILQFPTTAEVSLQISYWIPLALQTARHLGAQLRRILSGKDQLGQRANYRKLQVGFDPYHYIRLSTDCDDATSRLTLAYSSDQACVSETDMCIHKILQEIAWTTPNIKCVEIGAYDPTAVNLDEQSIPAAIISAVQYFKEVRTVQLHRACLSAIYYLLIGAFIEPDCGATIINWDDQIKAADIPFPHLRYLWLAEPIFLPIFCDCHELAGQRAKYSQYVHRNSKLHDKYPGRIRKDKLGSMLQRLTIVEPRGLCTCNRGRLANIAQRMTICTKEEAAKEALAQRVAIAGIRLEHDTGDRSGLAEEYVKNGGMDRHRRGDRAM